MNNEARNRLTRIDLRGIMSDSATGKSENPTLQLTKKSSVPAKSTANRLQTRMIEPRSRPIKLRTVEAAKAKLRPYEYIEPRNSSPWNTYDKKFQLKIKEYVSVAVKKALPDELSVIKSFDEEAAYEKILMLQRLRHERFVLPLEVYNFDQTSFVVFDYIPLSLAQVVESPVYPDQEQLAAILRQVIQVR